MSPLSIELRWFPANVLQLRRAGFSNGSLLAKGSLHYFDNDVHARHATYAVDFLVGQRVSVTSSTVHTRIDPTPCSWRFRKPGHIGGFETPDRNIIRGLSSSNEPIGNERFSSIESSLSATRANVFDLTTTVSSLAAQLYGRIPDTRTAELSHIQNLLRSKIASALQKSTTKVVRRSYRKQPQELLNTLTFGGIIRSFLFAEFAAPLQLFRSFAKTVHERTNNSAHSWDQTTFHPRIENYALHPSPNKKYMLVLSSYASLCTSIALNQPETRQHFLYRAKGNPSLLGVFSRNSSNPNSSAIVAPGLTLPNDTSASLDFQTTADENSSYVLFLPDATYKDDESRFRHPFETRNLLVKNANSGLPFGQYFPYNSFSISWTSDPPLAPNLRTDPALANIAMGTVRISVPTLTFATPSVASTIREFMTSDVIAKTSNCSFE